MESDGHLELDAISVRQITARQRATWARGDFHVLALQVLGASEALVQAMDPHAGDRVLDVACGSGNAALIAARRYCEVTGIDYVPALLERATVRAAAEGTTIRFEVADAQALPFEDQSFDALTSVFGVMFAPSQPQAAAEMVRVCRPGGTIGLASWRRGQWYAMQVEATNNYEVSRPISILCGGLDRQIEHHLFPTFPPERLREIAPEVRAICERHGVAYKTDTWGRTLKKALAHVGNLARAGGMREVMREMA